MIQGAQIHGIMFVHNHFLVAACQAELGAISINPDSRHVRQSISIKIPKVAVSRHGIWTHPEWGLCFHMVIEVKVKTEFDMESNYFSGSGIRWQIRPDPV